MSFHYALSIISILQGFFFAAATIHCEIVDNSSIRLYIDLNLYIFISLINSRFRVMLRENNSISEIYNLISFYEMRNIKIMSSECHQLDKLKIKVQ